MNELENMIEEFKKNNYLESSIISNNNHSNNKIKWPFIESPFFDDIEIEEFKNYYAESSNESYHDYFNESVPKINNKKTQKTYGSRIIELQNKLKETNNPEECDQIKQQLLDLGWNPEIEYNTESQIKARKRFETIMNERLSQIEIEDITSFVESIDEYNDIITEGNNNSSLHAVHLVLVQGARGFSSTISKITNSDYTHSALALDCDFSKLYSYNINNSNITKLGGFVIENIKDYPKNGKLKIYTFFVNNLNYKKIKERLKYFIDNSRDTIYNVLGFIAFPFNNINLHINNSSYICSEFVDSIMKLCNMDITKTKSSKVSPGGLNRSAISAKLFKSYDGLVKNLKENKIKKAINKLIMNRKIKETAIMQEAKKLPIEVKNNGDVLLTKPIIDFNSEYMMSHRLLLQYEKVKNINGMKYELARLYYMNYILEKKIYHNHFLNKKEENIKVRARILNDFDKYMKIVLRYDSKFNFAEYYQDSIFYPNTIEIKKGTLLSFKNLVNYIL